VAQTATLFDFDLQATGTVAAIAAATQDSIRLKGRAGGTATRTMDLVPAALGASRTVTFPDADGTVTYKELAQTWSATQTIDASSSLIMAATSGTAITLGVASATSSAIASSLGNIIRHRAYGYSSAYSAVQIGDSARGVGFGVDPNSITGGQFTGDAHDCFFNRGTNLIVPNAGGTDWECALRLSGGYGTANNPVVLIDGTGLTLPANAAGVLTISAATGQALTISSTTDGTSTTAASLVTAGGMAWGSSKTTYGGLLNLAGLLTAGGQLQTTGALTAVGASKLTLDQSAASVSRIIAFGEDDSTAGTLQLVAASSAVGIYDVCLSLTSAGVTSDRAWTLSNGLTVSGGNLQLSSGTLLLATSTPASASATGVQGTITWDSSYIYVCTATDTWKRVAIATW
jgi:hypothetical protein